MSTIENTPTPPASGSAAERKRRQVAGMCLLAGIGIAVSLWLALTGGGPAANQQLDAFVATKPEVVSLAGGNAPVITSDDVIPAFFSLHDMATPAEARIAIQPLFDASAPKQVWLFAEPAWAAGAHAADLAALVDDLKSRNIEVIMILPPQSGETEDDTLNTLAATANKSQVTFLDYHDGSKLGEALCSLEDNDADAAMDNEALATSLTTQQMLLHMAVNAPATRPVLKLADIGARIEKMKAEAGCAPTAEQAVEGSDAAPAATEAGDADMVPAAPPQE